MEWKFTGDELNKCSKAELVAMVISLQEQMSKLNENFEDLVEQIRIADQHRFGRQSEALDGQLSFFNECEYLSEEAGAEPDLDDILPQKEPKKKQKGKRDADLKDFPEEPFDHDTPKEKLDAFFGEGNWRETPAEEYKRLRYEPAS